VGPIAYQALLLGPNDPKRYAKDRSRTDPDGLGECDMRKMRHALTLLGYKRIKVASPQAVGTKFGADLESAIGACSGGGTFIFYFRGHASYESRDLKLRLPRSGGPSYYYPASALLKNVADNCAASHKLVILDCCTADEAAQDWPREIEDKVPILACINHVTKSNVLPDGGSVFTDCLYEALTQWENRLPRAGIIDKNGVIWSDQLWPWLNRQVTLLSAEKRLACCTPEFYHGSDNQPVRIAEIARHDRPHPKLPAVGSKKLVELLKSVEPKLVRLVFDELLDQMQPPYQPLRPSVGSRIDDLVRYLAYMPIRGHSGKSVPILAFGLRIAAEVGNRRPFMDWATELHSELGKRSNMPTKARVIANRGNSASIDLPYPGEPFLADRDVFHVFMSHNSRDKPTVRKLVKALQARNLKVWFDEEQLVPGRGWHKALEKIIQTTRSAAVLIGKDGIGPWEAPEMYACLSEFVGRQLPVIPVLLPDAPCEPEVPLFLRGVTWVDLRSGLTDDGLERLEWGITGIKPEPCASPTPPLGAERE